MGNRKGRIPLTAYRLLITVYWLLITDYWKEKQKEGDKKSNAEGAKGAEKKRKEKSFDRMNRIDRMGNRKGRIPLTAHRLLFTVY